MGKRPSNALILFFLLILSFSNIYGQDSTTFKVGNFDNPTVIYTNEVAKTSTEPISISILIAVTFLLIIATFLTIYYKDFISKILKIIFNRTQFFLFYNNLNNSEKSALRIFSIFNLLVISVLIWIITDVKSINFNINFKLLLLIITSVVFFWHFFKEVLLNISSFIFETQELKNIFLTHKFVLDVIFSIIAAITAFVLPYVSVGKSFLIIFIIALYLFFYLLGIINITITFSQKDFSLLVLILYLCTIEILPILIGLKFLDAWYSIF